MNQLKWVTYFVGILNRDESLGSEKSTPADS